MLAALEKCCKHSCNWSALKNWFCVKQQRKFTLHFVAQKCLQGLRGKIRGKALSWQHFCFSVIWRVNALSPALCMVLPSARSGEERGAGGYTEPQEQLPGLSCFSCAQPSTARMDRKATNTCREKWSMSIKKGTLWLRWQRLKGLEITCAVPYPS